MTGNGRTVEVRFEGDGCPKCSPVPDGYEWVPGRIYQVRTTGGEVRFEGDEAEAREAAQPGDSIGHVDMLMRRAES